MPGEVRKVLEDHTRGEVFKADCTKCNAETRHRVIASRNIQLDLEEEAFAFHSRDDFEIAECQGCLTVSMRHRHSDSEDFIDTENGPEYLDRIRLFPPRLLRATNLVCAIQLPHPIRDLYLEAAQGLDARLFHLVTLSCSPLIEAILRERNIEGRTPYHLIEGGVAAGLITRTEATILHKVRDIRNAADHEAERPLAESTIASFEVIERMLERFYVAPHIADRLKRPRKPGDPPRPNDGW